jgi:EAL domain-containing protein (putative c-di-GMP-specific phosphodiesterase class I)
LLRLCDERGDLIMPSGFLPSAERFGLATDIDQWVVTRAMELLAARRVREPSLRFSINLSAQTLGSPMIVDLIKVKLDELALDPAALTFEVTETAAIADMNTAVALLDELRAIGCRTALDDFGSGMSSFAYLRDLPVDVVKIDGRYVRHLVTSEVDQAMVRAMNEIAHALGKKTVAEYVENEEHFRLLGKLGVDYGQGYYLGQPRLIDAEDPTPRTGARSALQ